MQVNADWELALVEQRREDQRQSELSRQVAERQQAQLSEGGESRGGDGQNPIGNGQLNIPARSSHSSSDASGSVPNTISQYHDDSILTGSGRH